MSSGRINISVSIYLVDILAKFSPVFPKGCEIICILSPAKVFFLFCVFSLWSLIHLGIFPSYFYAWMTLQSSLLLFQRSYFVILPSSALLHQGTPSTIYFNGPWNGRNFDRQTFSPDCCFQKTGNRQRTRFRGALIPFPLSPFPSRLILGFLKNLASSHEWFNIPSLFV